MWKGQGVFKDLIFEFQKKKKNSSFKKNSNPSVSLSQEHWLEREVGDGVVNQRGLKRFKCWRVLQKALIFHSPRASKFAKHLIGWAYESRKALGWLPSPGEDLGKIPSLSSMEGYRTVV